MDHEGAKENEEREERRASWAEKQREGTLSRGLVEFSVTMMRAITFSEASRYEQTGTEAKARRALAEPARGRVADRSGDFVLEGLVLAGNSCTDCDQRGLGGVPHGVCA